VRVTVELEVAVNVGVADSVQMQLMVTLGVAVVLEQQTVVSLGVQVTVFVAVKVPLAGEPGVVVIFSDIVLVKVTVLLGVVVFVAVRVTTMVKDPGFGVAVGEIVGVVVAVLVELAPGVELGPAVGLVVTVPCGVCEISGVGTGAVGAETTGAVGSFCRGRLEQLTIAVKKSSPAINTTLVLLPPTISSPLHIREASTVHRSPATGH